MIRVAFTALLGRKFRVLLTGLAIVFGVAMISGTFVLTDTISKAFDEIFADSQQGSSVTITGKEVVSGSSSGAATVSATLLPKVKKVAGVLAAAGEVDDSAKVVGKDGKVVSTMGMTFARGVDFSQERFNPLTLVEGTFPQGAKQVAVDKATAENEEFKVGDTVRIQPGGKVRRFTLSAIVTLGSSESLAGATLVGFDLATAQALFDKKGQYDKISVAAKSGVSDEALVQRIRPILPSSAEAKTAAEQADDDAAEVSEGLSFLQYFLLAFAGISLFVGAFVIFNTLSITVSQRIREFATMRTLGASPGQVLQSVVLEAFVIGIVGSIVGLLLGVLLAKALSALLGAAGLSLPETSTVLAFRTIAVSLVVGTFITVAASLAPAFRATRVPPISAVREGATLPKSRLARYNPYIAAGAVLLALAILGYGMFAAGLATTERLVFLSVGCIILFLGIALLSARFMRPFASFIAMPNEKFGGFPGQMARGNTVRNPERTAATAAALMIGLALVTFVAVLGQGLRKSVANSVEKQVLADYIVSPSSGTQPFSIAAGNAVRRARGVEVSSSVRGDSARVIDKERTVTGINRATILKVYRFDWTNGSDAVIAGLGRRDAIITDRVAEDEDLKVGSRLKLVTSEDKRYTFTVKGVFEPPALGSLLGAVAISQGSFDASFPRPKNQNTFANVEGEPTEATTTAIEKRLDDFPDTKLETKDEFISSQQASISLLLSLLYVLLALSILVSLFGMINALALSILERTREIGLLRAVGMSRRQARSMVRHESFVIASIGAALGFPLGIFLAALVTRALKDEGIVFAVPGPTLVVFTIVGTIVGVVAAIIPARRAAKLNILDALRYE